MECDKTIVRCLFIILLPIIVSACAAPKIKQSVLMPANSNEMKNVKKLAVVGFSGDQNNQFSNQIETFFSNIRVNYKPYFSVINRQSLAAIMERESKPAELQHASIASTTQNQPDNAADGENVGIQLSLKDPMEIIGALLSSSDDTSTTSTKLVKKQFTRQDAIQMAKQAGADTIITGVVHGPRVDDTPYKEVRDICSEEVNKKCKKYKKVNVDCIKRTGQIDFTLKAVDINSGKNTFSKNYQSRVENKFCTDKKYLEKSAQELSDSVLKSAIAQTRNDVAPYIAVVTIELMEKDDSALADNQQAKMLIDTGLKYAKDSQMSQACNNFQMASQAYNGSPAIYHNLGVCAEIKNDLEQALNLYNKAASLSPKHVKLIDQALWRVQDRQSKNQLVQGQLRQ